MNKKVKIMKKKSGSRIVRVFSRIINIRRWADWDRLKAYTLYLGNAIKRLFVPETPVRTESFDVAMKRLKITDADLLIKQKALLRLSVVMLCAASFIFIYAGYHLFYGTFRATLVSLVVMMIALALAFRYHFWFFQIKRRQLGCTFKEWFRQGLMGEKE